MRSILIYKYLFIHRATLPDLFRKAAFLVVILSILSSFCLLLPVRNHNILAVYENSQYDYMIQGTNETQITELNDLDFIKASFPFSLMSSFIHIKNTDVDVTILACASLDNMNISDFPDSLITEKTNALSNDDNQIFIDYKLSKDYGLNIGSKVTIPFGSAMEDVEFVVTRIYEPHQVFGRYDVVIQWAGLQKEIYEREFPDEIGYSCAFIKTNNASEFVQYMENEFIPKGMLKSDDPDYQFDRSNMGNLYESREKRLMEEIRTLQYTPPVVAITSILGGIVFFIFVFREQSKRLTAYARKIAIFNLLGVSKAKISALFAVDTLILQIPVLIVSMLIVKYFVYNFLSSNNYLPINMAIHALLIEIVGIIVLAALFGLIAFCRLKKKNIPETLMRE